MIDTTTTTGRGRFVAPRPRLTLSGVTFELHRVGPSTLRDIRAAVQTAWRASADPDQREPQPPVVTTGEITEPNAADPDYQAAHAAWARALSQAVGLRVAEFAALYVLDLPDDAIDRAAVARYRRAMRLTGTPIASDADPDLTADEKDRIIYVARILLDGAAAAEIQQFNRWIYGGETPTEPEVADALATFPDPLAGPAAADGDPTPAAR